MTTTNNQGAQTAHRRICGNLLERTPLARGVGFWGGVWRRLVFAYRWPDYGLGVAGGLCTKEVDANGKHLDKNPRHNNPKMKAYIKTLDVYWD